MQMNMASVIIRWGIRVYLYARYYIEKATRSGGFGKHRAVYVKKSAAVSNGRLKDFLHYYHVKQFHESSCSVASVASAVNALLAYQGNAPQTPVTQHELLDRIRVAHWKERMGENGYKGKRGLPLDVLGQVVKKSLDDYGVSYRRMDIVSANPEAARVEKFKDKLRDRLHRFETGGEGLMIVHFNQGRFLPELHIPHISPVGGFDDTKGRVTMLDVDPAQQNPYRISFDTFYRGISCNYHHLFKPFGYTCGGYIWIQLNRNSA